MGKPRKTVVRQSKATQAAQSKAQRKVANPAKDADPLSSLWMFDLPSDAGRDTVQAVYKMCLEKLMECASEVRKEGDPKVGLIPSFIDPWRTPNHFPDDWDDDDKKSAVNAAVAIHHMLCLDQRMLNGDIDGAVFYALCVGVQVGTMNHHFLEKSAVMAERTTASLVAFNASTKEQNKKRIHEACLLLLEETPEASDWSRKLQVKRVIRELERTGPKLSERTVRKHIKAIFK
jgi:hypothetical protein